MNDEVLNPDYGCEYKAVCNTYKKMSYDERIWCDKFYKECLERKIFESVEMIDDDIC